jgi:hypothetical protein
MKTVLQEAASVDVILSLEGAAVSLLQNFDLRAMWQYMIISNSRDQKGVISKFHPDCSRMFLAVQSICVTEESVGERVDGFSFVQRTRHDHKILMVIISGFARDKHRSSRLIFPHRPCILTFA